MFNQNVISKHLRTLDRNRLIKLKYPLVETVHKNDIYLNLGFLFSGSFPGFILQTFQRQTLTKYFLLCHCFTWLQSILPQPFNVHTHKYRHRSSDTYKFFHLCTLKKTCNIKELLRQIHLSSCVYPVKLTKFHEALLTTSLHFRLILQSNIMITMYYTADTTDLFRQ